MRIEERMIEKMEINSEVSLERRMELKIRFFTRCLDVAKCCVASHSIAVMRFPKQSIVVHKMKYSTV